MTRAECLEQNLGSIQTLPGSIRSLLGSIEALLGSIAPGEGGWASKSRRRRRHAEAERRKKGLSVRGCMKDWVLFEIGAPKINASRDSGGRPLNFYDPSCNTPPLRDSEGLQPCNFLVRVDARVVDAEAAHHLRATGSDGFLRASEPASIALRCTKQGCGFLDPSPHDHPPRMRSQALRRRSTSPKGRAPDWDRKIPLRKTLPGAGAPRHPHVDRQCTLLR